MFWLKNKIIFYYAHLSRCMIINNEFTKTEAIFWLRNQIMSFALVISFEMSTTVTYLWHMNDWNKCHAEERCGSVVEFLTGD